MNRELLDQYIETLMKKSTPQSPAWNREQQNKTEYTWSYVNNLFLKAIMHLYKKSGKEEYLYFVNGFMDAYIMENGNILAYEKSDYNIDYICGGTVLLELYKETGIEKYRIAAELLVQQLGEHPRTAEGNFWHKKIYSEQVWLDGLYMAQPFLMRIGAERGNLKLCRDSFRQFQIVEKRMKDSATGLYFHGYDASRQAFWCDKTSGLSKSFWLRSLGWLMMAYVDTMEAMPVEMKIEKKQVEIALKELIDAMLMYKDTKSNMWYQVPDQPGREGNYLETSGSAMIAYSILKANRLNYIDDSYRVIGKNVFDGIIRTQFVEREGRFHLGGICLAAGLGGEGIRRDGTYEYYISEPIVEDDGKGVGPFVLAYTYNL